MIIVPESASPGRRMLTEMLREVNETQVPDEDILSDTPHFVIMKKSKVAIIRRSEKKAVNASSER